jgi:Tol biopolymer transport system component
VERGVRTKFTFDRADEVSPIWAPDSTRVAFTSNREGHFDLYQKAASGIGSEVLVLADDNEKYPTAWLPNRNAIMFWTFDENGTRLSLASLEGEEAPETVLDGSVNQGRLSPDGRWLAYYSGQSGRLEVYVVPYPEASDRWQVSINGGSYPRWTRGGREILFAGPDNRLMSVAVEPRGNRLSVQTPVPLFDVRPVTPRSFFAPAPEGDRVLVNMQQSDSRSTSITVVQSWSAALRP